MSFRSLLLSSGSCHLFSRVRRMTLSTRSWSGKFAKMGYQNAQMRTAASRGSFCSMFSRATLSNGPIGWATWSRNIMISCPITEWVIGPKKRFLASSELIIWAFPSRNWCWRFIQISQDQAANSSFSRQ